MSDQQLPEETAPFPTVKLPRRRIWRLDMGRESWRLEVAAIAQDIHYLSRWFHDQGAVPNSQALIDAIGAHLGSIQDYISKEVGANPTSILIHLEAAHANLLRLAPSSYVRSCLPSLVVQARRALDADDPRRTTLEDLAGKAESTELTELTEDQRQTIIECAKGADEQVRRTQSRLRSFRNVIAATAGFLFFLATILGVVSFLYPTLIPLCFVNSANGVAVVACPASESEPFIDIGETGERRPETPVRDIFSVISDTATPRDILLVEFVGFVAASLAAALAIRNVRGSTDPYSIPVALAFLKLPAGALTAVLGLVLIRAGLVPGIETLDTSAEIIAWALVFGYAQQLFTGIVDRQARSVLEQSGASPHSTRST